MLPAIKVTIKAGDVLIRPSRAAGDQPCAGYAWHQEMNSASPVLQSWLFPNATSLGCSFRVGVSLQSPLGLKIPDNELEGAICCSKWGSKLIKTIHWVWIEFVICFGRQKWKDWNSTFFRNFLHDVTPEFQSELFFSAVPKFYFKARLRIHVSFWIEHCVLFDPKCSTHAHIPAIWPPFNKSIILRADKLPLKGKCEIVPWTFLVRWTISWR